MSLRAGARRPRAPVETVPSHAHGSLHGAPIGLRPGVVLPPAPTPTPAPQPAAVEPVGDLGKDAVEVLDKGQKALVAQAKRTAKGALRGGQDSLALGARSEARKVLDQLENGPWDDTLFTPDTEKNRLLPDVKRRFVEGLQANMKATQKDVQNAITRRMRSVKEYDPSKYESTMYALSVDDILAALQRLSVLTSVVYAVQDAKNEVAKWEAQVTKAKAAYDAQKAKEEADNALAASAAAEVAEEGKKETKRKLGEHNGMKKALAAANEKKGNVEELLSALKLEEDNTSWKGTTLDPLHINILADAEKQRAEQGWADV
jgi:uncharacterized protein (DUF2147 family)